MNSRSLLVALIVLVLVGGVALLLSSDNINTPSTSPVVDTSPIGGGPGDTDTRKDVKEFMVKGMLIVDSSTGGRVPRFDTQEIRVKKGDKVRIVFENAEGFHDWTIDEFNARTRQIPAGETDTVEFVADKTGTFEYYCSVDGHRQMGMVGNLIVEE